MMRFIMCLFLSGVLFFSPANLPAKEISSEPDEHQVKAQKQEIVVQWAKDNLPQTGVLREEKHGFIYLKVDDDYIIRLFPMLHPGGYSKPPYFRRFDSPGAHISVFYVDERKQTGGIKEIGQRYSFTITGLASVPPQSHEYIVLEVESPGLEELRKKYGLSPLLKEHKFHITIAKKKRTHYPRKG